MSAPRVALHTLGCKVNAYDTAALRERLQAAGCRIVAIDDVADVVVVNSCTVTDAADSESRRLARRVRRRNPRARVVLTGCYAQTRPSEASAVPAVDLVVGTNRPDDVVRAVLAVETEDVPAIAVSQVRRATGLRTMGARRFGTHTRAFLKVQEGCDLFCTFCIVPMARGRSRSLAPRTVARELAALAAAGFEEVVLTGVHLGGYGHDLAPAVDLAALVEAVTSQGLRPRLRLSSIDPHEITERLVDQVAAHPGLCPHFHVPLQAGDDEILRAMRRRYDTTLAGERLAMIRERLPEAGIGTDLIAGFPGESDDAFERTVAFVQSMPITYAHVFPYSVRSGTTAAKLPGRLPPPVVRARARRLRRLAEAKRTAFQRRHADRVGEVLVEHQRDRATGRLKGYTANYVRVLLDGPDRLMGSRHLVRLRPVSGVVEGTLVE